MQEVKLKPCKHSLKSSALFISLDIIKFIIVDSRKFNTNLIRAQDLKQTHLASALEKRAQKTIVLRLIFPFGILRVADAQATLSQCQTEAKDMSVGYGLTH